MKHPKKALDLLEAYLHKHLTLEDGMTLSEFDGYCAGLIVCPEMIMPSEWLPHVWGKDNAPQFDNPDDLQDGMSLVMGHYNRVAKSLTPPCDVYETIYGAGPNSDDVLWEPWIDGFCKAMDLRPDAWEAYNHSGDEELISDLNMLLIMQGFCIGEIKLLESEIAEIDEHAPDMIPNIILNLNDWVKSRPQKGFPLASLIPANLGTKPSQSKKVGRNDLCICGSGKKYKKCCG